MRMTLTTFKRLYKDYQESGLNIKDFCTNQDLAPSTFYYWRNKLEEALAHEPDSFVPLEFDSNPLTTNNQSSPSIIKSKPTLNNDAPIEFLFPNGTKMLLRDNINTQVLKTIVHLFD
ncbi:IS66 family insertion sequence element accessory protein TnpA [Saccharicrinis fermentans]|uniref:IS66 family insertion sequence element accessory protein TnpA n=1 Tax=Saccharicrinis fermentans TaxID=982 RepID=UPI0004868C1A|nr:transposase [Saccharicrinis fermentans]